MEKRARFIISNARFGHFLYINSFVISTTIIKIHILMHLSCLFARALPLAYEKTRKSTFQRFQTEFSAQRVRFGYFYVLTLLFLPFFFLLLLLLLLLLFLLSILFLF